MGRCFSQNIDDAMPGSNWLLLGGVGGGGGGGIPTSG